MAPHNALLIYFTAYRTSHDAIKELLNAKDLEQQNERTRRWRDFKLQELYFVGITVRSLCTHSTFTDATSDLI